MRLLSPQKKEGSRPKGKSEVDFTRIKSQEDIKKILEEQKEKGKLEWFEYEQEVQAKLKELTKVFALLENTEKEFGKFAEILRTTAQKKFESIEGKIGDLEKKRAEIEKPLADEQKVLWLFLSEIKEERKEQEKQAELLTGKAELIRKNIADFSELLTSTEKTEAELNFKKKEIMENRQKAEEAIEVLRKISKEVQEVSDKAEQEYLKIQQKAELNNIKIASAEKLAEMTENSFQNWEQKLLNREKALQAAFKEARQKGIY